MEALRKNILGNNNIAKQDGQSNGSVGNGATSNRPPQQTPSASIPVPKPQQAQPPRNETYFDQTPPQPRRLEKFTDEPHFAGPPKGMSLTLPLMSSSYGFC